MRRTWVHLAESALMAALIATAGCSKKGPPPPDPARAEVPIAEAERRPRDPGPADLYRAVGGDVELGAIRAEADAVRSAEGVDAMWALANGLKGRIEWR